MNLAFHPMGWPAVPVSGRAADDRRADAPCIGNRWRKRLEGKRPAGHPVDEQPYVRREPWQRKQVLGWTAHPPKEQELHAHWTALPTGTSQIYSVSKGELPERNVLKKKEGTPSGQVTRIWARLRFRFWSL